MKATAKFDRPASKTFHAVTHVWGREYLDVFLNVCIPNQLAPGNVPALPPGSRYRILTRSVHVAELDTHPMVHALRDVIPVDIVVVEALDRKNRATLGHDLMIACHQRAIADVLEANAAIIMLSADFVLSEGALAAVVGRHREGYRAVVNTGLRLAKEPFLLHLHQSGASLAELSSRELVRMGLAHLHSHEQSMFADARTFSLFPVAVYWRVGNEGLLARCLHLHPLMVDPLTRASLRGSNDGRYVHRVCPDPSTVHVVTDSDELQMFELTRATRTVLPSRGAGASTWRTAAVASTCDPLQLGYFRHQTVRVHAGDLDNRWTVAAMASDAFAGRVLNLLPYGRVLRRYFVFCEHTRQRRDRYRRVWRRTRPDIRLKQMIRPMRIAMHRSARMLRKTTRRVLRQVVAR